MADVLMADAPMADVLGPGGKSLAKLAMIAI
jgi:hypothetical protein